MLPSTPSNEFRNGLYSREMRYLLPAAALWRGSDVDGIGHFAVDLDLDECTTLEAAAV